VGILAWNTAGITRRVDSDVQFNNRVKKKTVLFEKPTDMNEKNLLFTMR